MSKRWLVPLIAASIVFLAGCSTGQTGAPPGNQTHTGNQNGGAQGRPGNMSSQQRQQFQQEFRSGKVVSFTAGTVTVAVEGGGADAGTNATYNLTGSTSVRKDRSLVSASGQVPDLGSLGLKSGYYVTLMVDSGNVVRLQFNSDGSRIQARNGPAPGSGGQNQGPPNSGSAPAQ